MKAEIVLSDTVNPYKNLALEEYLCQNIEKDTFILYLWQNDNTVVIGRNQNPYLQCDMNFINKYAVRIARRMTGGGAVYHDLGNLNYSMITEREAFCIEKNFQIVLDVLEELQIHAKRSGRNDIMAGTGKISGTAFLGNAQVKCQHGCMIVDTDIKKMFQCLQVRKDKISGKDIDSVKTRVVNMNEIQQGLTVEMLKNKFIEIAKRIYPEYEMLPGKLFYEKKEYCSIRKRYDSVQWNMGNQAEFKMVLYDRFAWGDCSIIFDIDQGYIKEAGIYTDCLETGIFRYLADVLKGVEFSRTEILKTLNTASEDAICKDICSLIAKEKQLYDHCESL